MRAGPAAIHDLLRTAIEHAQGGRLDQAAAVLTSAGGAALANPVGRNILGDVRLKQGRPNEALAAFDAALAMAPEFPEAHCNRGVALQELGRLGDALAAEERALALRPAYATAHFNRGNILKDLGRVEEAIAAYGQALQAQPTHVETLVNRGVALADAGRPGEAVGDFRKARMLRPGYAAAEAGLARTLAAAKRRQDSVASAPPPDPTVAIAEVARVHRLLAANRLDEALAVAERVVRLAPAIHEAHMAQALALSRAGRFDEAGAALEAAGRLGAGGVGFEHLRGVALSNAGRLAEGLAAHDRAIAVAPDNATFRYFRSFALLMNGNFAEGWAEHEWRLKLPGFDRPDLLALAPLWRGEDLRGRRILLYAEQGHGDAIQFARYVPLVAARGAEVTLLVQPALAGLMATSLPQVAVIDAIGTRRDFDYQAPLMSLAHLFASNSEPLIPRDVPYLTADPARVAKWGARIGDHGFKIGVSWQGNMRYGLDRRRSIPLARFAPLAAVPGVRLISLQAVNGLDQLHALPDGMAIETLGPEISDNPDGFRETAAAMANLDLMILSDSGPAHLAGALGLPVWLALRDHADWRWLAGRDDSPWYPSMRLFRQKTADDWDGLFGEIAARLSGGGGPPHGGQLPGPPAAAEIRPLRQRPPAA